MKSERYSDVFLFALAVQLCQVMCPEKNDLAKLNTWNDLLEVRLNNSNFHSWSFAIQALLIWDQPCVDYEKDSYMLGLKQAVRVWNYTIDGIFMKMGFRSSTIDPRLYGVGDALYNPEQFQSLVGCLLYMGREASNPTIAYCNEARRHGALSQRYSDPLFV